MEPDSSSEITRLLKAWKSGDEAALARLTPLVYDELRRVARRYVKREAAENTLQPTALAHEAYMRLAQAGAVDWTDRAHFFAVCARMMRRILVDAARARRSEKRGGPAGHLNLDQAPEAAVPLDREMVALDDALNALTEVDPRMARVVELRFFGGLSVEETAAVLRISERSVLRDWKLAKAWLGGELTRG